jgi:hypothetical protein
LYCASPRHRATAPRDWLQTGAGRAGTTDSPFAESKGLIAGYALSRAASLEEATACGRRYLEVVGAERVDVRPVEEPGEGVT